MAQQIHYEILRRHGAKGGWTPHEVVSSSEAALTLARGLMAEGNATGGPWSRHTTSTKGAATLIPDDESLEAAARERIRRRLAPEIARAFQFTVTHMERHIVCRYDVESRSFFSAHRDNTTKGTAHRRFAVTINLNAGEYEGGDLRLPEFGTRAYRAPTGDAAVFSRSLMHEALPVTKGERYAFLPFLYDDEAAKIREAANSRFLDESLGAHRAGASSI